MIKQIVVPPDHGIIVNNKKEQATDTDNNLDGFQGLYAKWKKNLTLHYSIYIIFSK